MNSKFFYLAGTKVLFTQKGENKSLDFNVLLALDEPKVTQHDIGHIQQNAQHRLFSTRGYHPIQDSVDVKDVFIYGISFIGHMTNEEFLVKPPAPTMEELKEALQGTSDTNPVEQQPEVDPPSPDVTVVDPEVVASDEGMPPAPTPTEQRVLE